MQALFSRNNAPNVGPLLDLRTAFQHHRIMKMFPQDRVSRRARATLKMPCLIDRRFPREESTGMLAVEALDNLSLFWR